MCGTEVAAAGAGNARIVADISRTQKCAFFRPINTRERPTVSEQIPARLNLARPALRVERRPCSQRAAMSVETVFDECQRASASSAKGVAVLRKLHNRDPEACMASFWACVHRLLLVFKREPAVQRLVGLVVEFATLPQIDIAGAVLEVKQRCPTAWLSAAHALGGAALAGFPQCQGQGGPVPCVRDYCKRAAALER